MNEPQLYSFLNQFFLHVAVMLALEAFLAAIYLSRARLRRAIGALAGGVAGMAFAVPCDIFFTSRGWWSYPDPTPLWAPPSTYVAAALALSSFMIVAWLHARDAGRWLVATVIIGFMLATGDIVVGPIILPDTDKLPAIVIVFFLFILVAAVARGVMWLVAGPSGDDELRNNLAKVLKATKSLAEAEPMYRRALAIDEATYGEEHPRVAIRLKNLAALLEATNRLAEAEPLMRRALEIDEARYGRDHARVVADRNKLTQLLKAMSPLVEAAPPVRRSLPIDKASWRRTVWRR